MKGAQKPSTKIGKQIILTKINLAAKVSVKRTFIVGQLP